MNNVYWAGIRFQYAEIRLKSSTLRGVCSFLSTILPSVQMTYFSFHVQMYSKQPDPIFLSILCLFPKEIRIRVFLMKFAHDRMLRQEIR